MPDKVKDKNMSDAAGSGSQVAGPRGVVNAEEELQKIVSGAQAEKSITAADLAEKLSVLAITTDETDAVYQQLVELGVEIVEDEDLVEELEEEAAVPPEPAPDVDEERQRARREVDMAMKAPTNDPVRMYL